MSDSGREPDAPEDNPPRVNVVPEITAAPPRRQVDEQDTASFYSSEEGTDRASEVGDGQDAASVDEARRYRERLRARGEDNNNNPDTPSISAAQDVEPSESQIGKISIAGILVAGAFVIGGPVAGAIAVGAIAASMNSSQKNKTSMREAKAQALYEKERADTAELKNKDLQRQLDTSNSNGIPTENDRDSVDQPLISNNSVELPEREESMTVAARNIASWMSDSVLSDAATERSSLFPDATPSQGEQELGRG